MNLRQDADRIAVLAENIRASRLELGNFTKELVQRNPPQHVWDEAVEKINGIYSACKLELYGLNELANVMNSIAHSHRDAKEINRSEILLVQLETVRRQLDAFKQELSDVLSRRNGAFN